MQTVMVDYRDIIIFHLSIYDLQGCMKLIALDIWLLLPTVVYSLGLYVLPTPCFCILGNTMLL